MLGIITWLGGVRATIFAALLVAVSAWGSLQWLQKTTTQHNFAAYKMSQELAVAAVKEQAAQRYQTLTLAMAQIGEQYEQKLARKEASRQQLVADLRTAKRKLRPELTCPTVAGSTPTDLARADEAARIREQIAAETIADADHADAWIVSLQEVIRKYQEILNGRK